MMYLKFPSGNKVEYGIQHAIYVRDAFNEMLKPLSLYFLEKKKDKGKSELNIKPLFRVKKKIQSFGVCLILPRV